MRLGCNFLRAFDAHSGVGLICSNCLRSLRSYSRPPTASSADASRSFRRRVCEVRDTCILVSSGSTQAGAPRVPGWGVIPRDVSRSGSVLAVSSNVSCSRGSGSSSTSTSAPPSFTLNALASPFETGAFIEEDLTLSSMKNSLRPRSLSKHGVVHRKRSHTSESSMFSNSFKFPSAAPSPASKGATTPASSPLRLPLLFSDGT